MNKAVLQIQELTKTFNMGESSLQVLKGINLTILAGEIVVIVGPSGACKSTLLNIAGGLMRPSSGSVLLSEQAVFNRGEEGISWIRNQLVGFIFQMHHLLPEFSAMENVAMPGLIAGQSRAAANQQSRELLKQVGLEERWKHRPGE
ncbi:ATP-binding cassette domain-containing protein, partial [bacterium]|nr:ATP-binding cassette domain-containing protein [bacterium]